MLQPLFGIASILLATSALTLAQDPPATQPEHDEAEERRVELEQAEREVAVLPRVAVDRLDRLVRFDVEHDMLAVHTTLSPLAGEVRVITPDLPGIVRLRVLDLPAIEDPSTGRNFTLIHNDLTQPGSTHVITHVASIAGRIMLARDAESRQSRSSIQLIQDPPGTPLEPDHDPVRLLIAIYDADGNPKTDLKLSAGSFAELRRKHPRELETYLRPILRDFKQDVAAFAVDERVAWQVLGGSVEPDPQVAKRVKTALADFDADDFRQRESAIEKLREIGQPAALVLERMDRDGFSAEQNAGVDTFLADYLPLSTDDVERLGRSEEFLVDTLASDDAVLRRLAWERLQQVADRAVEFDPDADPEVRAEQILALRAQLTPPATQPRR